MLLAVATTNTRVSCSANQVNRVPRMRWLTPASLLSWPRPFSISSIHTTQGDIISASFNASRRLRSVSPKNLLYRVPKSSRNNGMPQCPATALAARLLPLPCTPNSSMPRGRSWRPAVKNACCRCSSHCFSAARPATSLMRAVSYSKLITPSISSSASLARLTAGTSS